MNSNSKEKAFTISSHSVTLTSHLLNSGKIFIFYAKKAISEFNIRL